MQIALFQASAIINNNNELYMSVIKGFIFKNKKILTFILLIVISFFLMFFSNQNAIFSMKKVGFSILYPFQLVVTSVGNFFQQTVNSISQIKKYQEEIENLRIKLEQYQKVIIDFNELNNENIELRKILELKQKIVYNTIIGEVIGRDPKNLFDFLIINKGSNSGIKENMPVITYAAGKKTLVGKVSETTPFASKIITLNNPKLSVGAIISNNGVHTIVEGTSLTPGIVRLLYLPKDYTTNVNNPDFIYTSGDSLIYPRGLEIGKIIKVYPSNRYEVYNEAEIQLSSNLSSLEYVIVLKVEYNKDDYKLMEGYNN